MEQLDTRIKAPKAVALLRASHFRPGPQAKVKPFGKHLPVAERDGPVLHIVLEELAFDIEEQQRERRLGNGQEDLDLKLVVVLGFVKATGFSPGPPLLMVDIGFACGTGVEGEQRQARHGRAGSKSLGPLSRVPAH